MIGFSDSIDMAGARKGSKRSRDEDMEREVTRRVSRIATSVDDV